MTKKPLPANVIVKKVLVTDLSQVLKKQRDFLRWMGRRYTPTNPDQGAAFFTGAEKIDEIRDDLLAGFFDVEPATKDLLTRAAASSNRSPEPAAELADRDFTRAGLEASGRRMVDDDHDARGQERETHRD